MIKKLCCLLFVLFLLLPCGAFAGGKLRCEQCGKSVRKKYIKRSDQKIYCSQSCFDKSLPHCNNCGKVCHGKYIKFKGRDYCSQDCIQKKLQIRCMTCGKSFNKGMSLVTPYGTYRYCMDCHKRPACLICQRPLKTLTRLPNQGWICRQCNVNIVKSDAELRRLFREVQMVLQKKFNFKFDHRIKLYMRSYGPNRQHKFIENQELGVYIYQGRQIISVPRKNKRGSKKKQPRVHFENEICTIAVLDHLPRVKLAEVLAHELAHDYMQHRWPFIQDKKIKEGFAELVAAEYNLATGNGKWNYRMENSRDEVYGDGYRLLRSWYKKGGWKEVYRCLNIINRKNHPAELR